MKQKHTKYTQMNTNRSTHSEMGPRSLCHTISPSVEVGVQVFLVLESRVPTKNEDTASLQAIYVDSLDHARIRLLSVLRATVSASSQVNPHLCTLWGIIKHIKMCFTIILVKFDEFWTNLADCFLNKFFIKQCKQMSPEPSTSFVLSAETWKSLIQL